MNSNSTDSSINNPLGFAPIPKLISRFSIPAIIGMLVTNLYNIVDQIFIGNVVGIYGNAATNIAFPINILCFSFALMISFGTASAFNMAQGAKNTKLAKESLDSGMILLLGIGLILTIIVLVFRSPLIILCGATENVFPLAYEYISITSYGFIFLMLGNFNSTMIRADGSPRFSMLCMMVGAFLNIALDALFMMVLPLGIKGAAIATVMSQIISFIVSFSYFKRFKAFPFKLSQIRFVPSCALRVAKLGTSNFTNQAIMMIVNIILNNSLAHYGTSSIYGSDIPLAVAGVAVKVNQILISISVGLGQGCQPIHSYNTGAKRYDRVRETYITAISIAICVGIVFFAAFQLFPARIIGIFGGEGDLYYEFAARYLKIFFMMIALNAIQPITVGFFSATGNVKQGIILSLSRQGFILIPLLIVLPLFAGIDGVLYAAPIADFISFILALFMVSRVINLRNSHP